MTDRDAIVDQIHKDVRYYAMHIWNNWSRLHRTNISAGEYLGEAMAELQDVFEAEVMKEVREELNIPEG